MRNEYVNEKISDVIYQIGGYVVMKFNVVLAHRSEAGDRIPFHLEYNYESNKYNNCNKFTTIKRQYNYFFTIENTYRYNHGEKEFIVIGVQDILFFRDKMREAALWLRDSRIYMYKDNNIVKVGNVEPIVINLISFNKTITLEPIVMKSNQDLNVAGIRMTLGNNKENFSDLSVDRYMGLMYVIENFNMPMAAMMMLNYVGASGNIGHGEFSTPSNNNIKRSSATNGKPGRFVGDNKSASIENL